MQYAITTAARFEIGHDPMGRETAGFRQSLRMSSLGTCKGMKKPPHSVILGDDRFGYLYVAMAATFWGTSASMARSLFLDGMSPFELVQLRTTISAFSLFVALVLWKQKLLKIGRGDLIPFIFLGLTLAATQFTYLFAISKLQAATAILLQYQAPVMIAVYAKAVQKKEIGGITAASLVGAVAGCYLVVGAYSFSILRMNGEGIVAGLASAATFAAYTLRSERIMERYSPWTVVFYSLLCAAISWNLLYPPLSAFRVPQDPLSWLLVVFIGVFGTVVPFGLYNEGVRLISATRASITSTLEPVIAFLVSYWFLGEVLESLQVLGAALIIASIVLLRAKDIKESALFAGKVRTGRRP